MGKKVLSSDRVRKSVRRTGVIRPPTTSSVTRGRGVSRSMVRPSEPPQTVHGDTSAVKCPECRSKRQTAVQQNGKSGPMFLEVTSKREQRERVVKIHLAVLPTGAEKHTGHHPEPRFQSFELRLRGSQVLPPYLARLC